MITECVSAQTRAELVKLSTYLREVDSRPSNLKFDMETFYSPTPHECGSSACAIGHYAIMIGWQPMYGGIAPPEGQVVETCSIGESNVLGWQVFSRQVLGLSNRGSTEEDWDWLFSGEWGGVDNTALGAAARIDYYLEHGVPDPFSISSSLSKYNETMVDLYKDYRHLETGEDQ